MSLPRVDYYTWGVSLRKRKQKKNQFTFSKVSATAYKRVSAYGNLIIHSLTWEVKRGFEKASVSGAVRLRECPLAES